MSKKKYTINHIFPPSFATINGQRYLFPGWIPVEDDITFEDVEHINPYANVKVETFEDPGCKAQAHADLIYEKINDYGFAVDIEVEAKAKEIAVLKYKEEESKLLESYLPFDRQLEVELT